MDRLDFDGSGLGRDGLPANVADVLGRKLFQKCENERREPAEEAEDVKGEDGRRQGADVAPVRAPIRVSAVTPGADVAHGGDPADNW